MSRASATSEKPKGFSFEELDDAAKEAARDWWRSCSGEDRWFESVYEDSIQVFMCFGFSVSADDMQFSGFSSQGDGASFGGHYIPPDKSHVDSITEYAPDDEELKVLAEEFDVIQVTASLRWNAHWRFRVVRQSSHYAHSGCMDIQELSLSDNADDPSDDRYSIEVEENFERLVRCLADWHYRKLEQESEYLDSEECVDEALVGSDYRFDKLGHII